MKKEYDILIVGAGSAGMMCAIAAAEKGSKVLVVEKDTIIGGTLHVTAGHLSAGGTRRQYAKKIQDSWRQHYADVMRISNDTAQSDLVRLATRLAPVFIDWLEDKGYNMVDMAPVIIYGHEPYQTARTYWGKDDTRPEDTTTFKGKSIFQTIKPLWDKQVKLGNIDLVLNHKMTSILTKNKKVIGIEAENLTSINHSKDSTPSVPKEIGGSQNAIFSTFLAKKTVLTTGGYASNPQFFKENTPQNPRLISTARLTSQGEGIVAAQKIGAAFVGSDKHVSTLGGIEFEPQSGRSDFWKAFARVSNAVDRLPREIYVNERGERFINEDEASVDRRERIIMAQPNQRFWLIFDEQALLEEGLNVVAWLTPQDIQKASLEEKWCWQAQNLEDLAKKIGLNNDKDTPSVFSQNINNFNQSVDNQEDTYFNRVHLNNKIVSPPYYAILTYAHSLISFGGLSVDKYLKVQNTGKGPIPNLYAVGEILGAGATSGNAFCGGMLLTPALVLGKYLGERLSSKEDL
jgi:fumarate reductase flavoprotein subunit